MSDIEGLKVFWERGAEQHRRQLMGRMPPWKRHDPRVTLVAEMIGSGPHDPADAMAALDGVQQVLDEAEHELFYDVNINEPSRLMWYAGGHAFERECRGPLIEQIDDVIVLARWLGISIIGVRPAVKLERIVVDAAGAGLMAYEALRRDSAPPADATGHRHRRPWVVVKLDRIAGPRRAAS